MQDRRGRTRWQVHRLFSAEYGSPSVPIYSGGLGILSGDHLKSASDRPALIGVGLLYQQGYFRRFSAPTAGSETL
jgi:glucan phosphorylase